MDLNELKWSESDKCSFTDGANWACLFFHLSLPSLPSSPTGPAGYRHRRPNPLPLHVSYSLVPSLFCSHSSKKQGSLFAPYAAYPAIRYPFSTATTSPPHISPLSILILSSQGEKFTLFLSGSKVVLYNCCLLYTSDAADE